MAEPLPTQWLHDELDKAISYFAERKRMPVKLARDGTGEFTITFAEVVDH